MSIVLTDSTWPNRIAANCALVAGAIAFAALIGWSGNIAVLRQVIPGAMSMNPLTGIGLLSLSAALWLARRNPARMAVARAFALIAILLGLVRLLDQVGAGIQLDSLLFRSQLEPLGPAARMAVGTAICLVCLGGTLLLHRPGSPADRRTRWLVLPAALIALLGAAGYLFDTQALISLPKLSTIALNTLVALLVLCLGITALSPAVPPASTLTLPGAAGATARRLLPAAFLLPFLVGWIRVYGQRAGWFDLGFGTAIISVFNAVVMTLLVLLSVWLVQRGEAAQRQLETGLRESERRLFQILEAIPLGLYVLDRTGRPYYSNQRSTEILGSGLATSARSPEETARRYNVRRAGTGEEYPPDQLPISHALRGERAYKTDLELHQPNRIVPIEVWSAPVTAPDGSVEFAISAFNDISQRLETERQIEALNAELKHQVAELASVNRELETFSYSVSHDLRAPLRAVDGFSRMLVEDHGSSLGPDAVRLLDRIRANIRRMGLLIDDLLKFSRLSRTELESTRVDMGGLARSVLDDLMRTRERPVPVVIGDLPPALGDVNLLRQVWTNLIDNGLKYSAKQADPRLEVGGKSNGQEVTYWVRDNGVGFDMKYSDKLFGVFQRLHSQDEFEGTGVGLAIVQRVIYRHGGRVWAEATPGLGATFSFCLPVGGPHVAG